MRTALVVALAAALVQPVLAQQGTAAPLSTAVESPIPDSPSVLMASSSSSRLPNAGGEMMSPAAPPAIAVISTPGRGQESAPPRPMRKWMALAAMQHGAATFDAWSTRAAMSNGARELNPLVRPFANSNAIYPALQVMPFATDFISLKMMNSRRPAVRKMWWLPQVLAMTGSTASGAINLSHTR